MGVFRLYPFGTVKARWSSCGEIMANSLMTLVLSLSLLDTAAGEGGGKFLPSSTVEVRLVIYRTNYTRSQFSFL